jgi:hypothetical protein
MWPWVLGIAVTGLAGLGVLRLVRHRHTLAPSAPPRHAPRRTPSRRPSLPRRPFMLTRPAIYLMLAAAGSIMVSVLAAQSPQ